MKSNFTQRTISVKDLIPNPKNPRIDLRPGMPLYETLKASIEHFGYLDPIIWNKQTGMIVSGHQRFQVMKDLAEARGESLDSIEVIEVDMPEDKQDAFMIAVNKITGLWDTEKLTSLIKELSEEEISYIGFEDFEIDALLNGSDESSLIGSDDDYSDSPKNPTFKLTIYFDSEEAMDSAYDSLTESGYNVKR